MSTLSQFASGGVKQIITAFIKDLSPTNTGSPGATLSEDYFYRDITHGGTVNISKCVVIFDGACVYQGQLPAYNSYSTNPAYFSKIVTARLTSATNLRLSCQYDTATAGNSLYFNFSGRYTIIEYF